MAKWIAKVHENDDFYGEEIRLGIAGGEDGFDIIMSNDEDSGVMPGMTVEEARENLEDYFGYYDTFRWLDAEE